MRRSHSSEADSKAPAPERVLRRLGSLLDILSGRRAINLWIPRSRIEQASRLRSRTLSDWSWLWWQPCRYIRLWRAGRDLTNQRREVHNCLLLSRSASDPDLVDLPRRAINLWIPRSRIEQASRLRSRTLSDWSWLWWQPCRYIRLWRAGRDLTNQRREVHNCLLLSRSASDPDLVDLNEAQRRAVVNLDDRVFVAISEFPKWRKYLISLSFRGQSSRPVQVGGFDVNIVIHRSTAVRGRGGPARHDAWPPSLGAILPTRTGPVEADGAVDAQNAPTAPWKTRSVFHELPQGFSHQITHEKHRKAPK